MTGHLKDALNSVLQLRAPNKAKVMNLELATASQKIEQLLGDGGNYKPPQMQDILMLWHKLNTSEISNDYAKICNRDWQNAPWCFWLKVAEKRPLVQRIEFMGLHREWLKTRQGKRDYRILIQAWLMYCVPENNECLVKPIILAACKQWPEWIWAKRHAKDHIFDPSGLGNLAENVLFASATIDVVLQAHGISAWLQIGKYTEAIFVRALNLIASDITPEKEFRIKRIVEWAKTTDGDLRFPEQRRKLAEALLLPWVSVSAPQSVEKELIGFFVNPKILGDPRFDRIKWHDINVNASLVLERWLNKETLSAFAYIIKEATKGDHTAKDHWRERYDFWMGYYKSGCVSKVWIALGTDARLIAYKHTNLRGQFGNLHKEIQPNHSVLLLQIGNLWVADWSHNGACRIWTEEVAKKLGFKFYERIYTGPDLRRWGNLVQRHQGRWQYSIHEFIRRETGIKIY